MGAPLAAEACRTSVDRLVRIRPLMPAEATGRARRALASPVGHMKLFRLLAHAEGNIVPLMKLGSAILADQKLPARSRELMILGALALNRGRYEWPQHVEIGLDAGLDASQIRAIEKLDFTDPALSRQEQDLLAFTRAIVENVRIDEGTFGSARAWLDDREVVEAVVAIGFYMMLARLTEACEIDADAVQGINVVQSVKRQHSAGEEHGSDADPISNPA